MVLLVSSIGSSVTQAIPTVGEAGTSYATKIVAFLTEVKSRLEAKLPVTSILAGILDMANNAIQNLAYIGLYERVSTPTTPVGSLQRYQNNLWYVSNSGAFQVTNGAALNYTSLKGFTGDYGSPNPAEAKFVDSTTRYDMYDDQSGGIWAYVRGRGFDVAGGATSANRVRIDWAGSSSYSLTLPAAAPGSTVAVQMASSGALTASSTFAAPLTATDFKYTTAQTLCIPACAVQGTIGHTFQGAGWALGTATTFLWYPIPVRTGEVIGSWTLYLNKTSASGTITASLGEVDSATLASTLVGVAQTNSANNPGAISLTQGSLAKTAAANKTYVVVVQGGGITGDFTGDLFVTVTR